MRKSGGYGLCAVGKAEKVTSFTFSYVFRALRYLVQNAFTLLFSWVFISNNEKFCHLCSNPSHNRTFLHITLAGGAKNDQELPDSQRPQGCQYFFQAIGRMGIINDDCKRLHLRNVLHPACHASYFGQAASNSG